MTPLPTLLSQAYVAFTIEFDNEWERRLREGGRGPRFMVSYVMWANFMRWVTKDGIRVADLEERAGVWNGPIHLDRMEKWWGYVVLSPGPDDRTAKPRRDDMLVRPGPGGELSLSAWEGLDAWVEKNWLKRAGRTRVSALQKALAHLERQMDLDLPDAMPVLGYTDGYRTPRPENGPASPARSRPQTIGALIARVLLAFTLEYEEASELPLAVGACVLRVLGDEPVSVKEVPIRAGVRKEATDPALKWLANGGYLKTQGAGAKMTVSLSAKGKKARNAYFDGVAAVESDWAKRFGKKNVAGVRAALEAFYDVGKDGPLIAAGLNPPAGCWRGSKAYIAQTEAFLSAPREYLPHHPLLTHRGGWPDGA